MQGKIHPYWYIPTTTFPYKHTIRAYKSVWNWYQTFETDNENIIFSTGYFETNNDEYITISFNSKVSQFNLTEKVYTTNNSPTDSQFIFQRINTIHCYYPDDFETISVLSPADGTLTISDMDSLFTFKGMEDPIAYTDTFEYYEKVYVGRRYDNERPWVMEINPHSLAETKNITDYDFALMKYVYYGDIGDKVVVSDRNYYPLGWFENDREYWTLFNKNDNERLRCIRDYDYYGVGIFEIQYLKLV